MFFQLFKLIYNFNGNLNQLKENISKGYVIFVKDLLIITNMKVHVYYFCL